MSCSLMARMTSSSSPPTKNWMPDTLTDRCTAPMRVLPHSAILRQASFSTQVPTRTIKPVSSRMGMNSAGDTMPWPGRFQRISASAPLTRPLLMSILGW
ncbi:hypothetical protein D9M68_927220 [compost metagenome]